MQQGGKRKQQISCSRARLLITVRMADEAEDVTFDPTKKKKKKVKADSKKGEENSNAADGSAALKSEGGTMDMSAVQAALPDDEKAADDAEGLDFSKMKKKKKDAKKQPLEERSNAQPASSPTDPDYTYAELLKRVYEIMRETNPSGPSRLAMKPPDVQRAGTKKTSFTNFFEICKALRRKPDHFQAFLLAELGTSGSIDGNQTLIIRGRYQPKQIESVVRSYIKEYVLCHTCKSPQTKLVKDTRLFFLQCDACSSRCSVVSVKSGYQAVTGKRAALRAKTGT